MIGGEECIAIPVKENIFVSVDKQTGQDKGYYLDVTAFEMKEPKNGSTHLIKPVNRHYKEQTEEERNNVPIIGSISPVVAQAKAAQEVQAEQIGGNDFATQDAPF